MLVKQNRHCSDATRKQQVLRDKISHIHFAPVVPRVLHKIMSLPLIIFVALRLFVAHFDIFDIIYILVRLYIHIDTI